jgi:hypothetical protein
MECQLSYFFFRDEGNVTTRNSNPVCTHNPSKMTVPRTNPTCNTMRKTGSIQLGLETTIDASALATVGSWNSECFHRYKNYIMEYQGGN